MGFAVWTGDHNQGAILQDATFGSLASWGGLRSHWWQADVPLARFWRWRRGSWGAGAVASKHACSA